MEQEKKLKNFIKTTIIEFFNEQYENIQHYDLFEYYEKQPKELKVIVDKYLNLLDKRKGYDVIKKFHDAVYKIGYTFDSGLDAEPHGLRPIGVKLNQLVGWEDIDN